MALFSKKPKSPKDGDKKIEPDGQEYRYDDYFDSWYLTGKKFKKSFDGYELVWMEIKENEVQQEPKYSLEGNTEEYLEKKKKKNNNPNLQIVVEKDNQLMLDYDAEEIPEVFEKMLSILQQRFYNQPIKWEKFRSSSGKHWHVIVDLPENLEVQERIAWQAIFGSDRVREAITLLKIAQNIKDPVVLFMDPTVPPVETGRLVVGGRKFKEIQ